MLNAHSDKVPSNYKEVVYWKISEKSGRLVMMNILPIPLAIVSGMVFFMIVRVFGHAPKMVWHNHEISIFLIGIIGVIALHEIVHGVAMHAFGAKVKYGFFLKGLMFYAKAPSYAFTRQQYLISVLSPLVSLSILAWGGIVLWSGTSVVWLLAFWAMVNASTAGADVWITTIVLRYPACAYIVDERDGMRILLPLTTIITEDMDNEQIDGA